MGEWGPFWQAQMDNARSQASIWPEQAQNSKETGAGGCIVAEPSRKPSGGGGEREPVPNAGHG